MAMYRGLIRREGFVGLTVRGTASWVPWDSSEKAERRRSLARSLITSFHAMSPREVVVDGEYLVIDGRCGSRTKPY